MHGPRIFAGVIISIQVPEDLESAGRRLHLASTNRSGSPGPAGFRPFAVLMNYGKYRYEQNKKAKKGKKSESQLKEIRLGPMISDHDYEFKIKHAENFLKRRHKVRISVIFWGCQSMYRQQGRELLKRVEEDLQEVGTPEFPSRDAGRSVFIILAPKEGYI